MECKCDTGLRQCLFKIELIDTLWNVNVLRSRRIARPIEELIDTLWNVN